MASLLSSEAKRMYSWWWDSHNTPKNSKWLLENLSDMDGKVKTMIKLIEEDADSFARKAEMYYKKRPELMKLVEEFYRAYRALAERYDHATGELRHAHRTMAKALRDKVPFEIVEDPSGSSAQEKEHGVLELNRTVRALLDADELVQNTLGHSSPDVHTVKTTDPSNVNLEWGLRRSGLKELPEMFGAKETVVEISKSSDCKGANQEKDREESLDDEMLLLSTENLNLKYKILHENERAGKAENEAQCLRKSLVDMEGEKEDILLQYQQCLQKLSKIEEQLNNAQKDSMGFSERAGQAETEIQTLKEALIQLEAEKNAGLGKQREYLEKISHLEAMVSQLQKDMKGTGSQAQTLEDEVSRLELEKEEVVRHCNQCLSKISDLENRISVMEDEIGVLKDQAESAEAEVSELKKALADANEEKEASAQKYKHCLETISKLEKDLSDANDNVQCLNNVVLVGNAKLKTAEGKCNLLELSNQTLQIEANNLVKNIAVKDQELLKKQEELEKLQSCLQDENVRHAQVEATLQALQDLHSQSQEDQKALALEVKKVLQMLKDVEVSKTVLEEEIQQVRTENHQLSQANMVSAVSMEGMQTEILSLREIKERLDKEVSHHVGIGISLKKEIFCLKDEIDDLNRSYQAIIEQVEASGLSPKCVATSVKSLQDENSRLREMREQEDSNEKSILSKKLEKMEEVLKKAAIAESSLSDLNAELESSCKKVRTLQETCQNLQGEKASLVGEKASLLSQLQSITENMQNLLEKNAVLENSLSTAKVELEVLREKSKGLEEICELLKNERSYILTEREALVSKLENAERKLEKMEKRYMGLGEKYASLQKEKEAMHCQVDKLEISLGIEKQERTSSQVLSESRLAGLENQIFLLQEENRWKKKESEEDLDKALKAQFELSILQKFIKDMEEKNCSLIIECQKHVEASKLAERVISELESESLEQQVESELLLDEIERLRLCIYQIFRSLETAPDYAPSDKIENEQAYLHHILERIEDMKCSISEHEDGKQQLLVENSVLLALLEQLKSNCMDIVSQKMNLEQEFKIMADEFAIVKNDTEKLQDLNRQLKSDASTGQQHVTVLKAELASLCSKQADLQNNYDALIEDYSEVNRENTYLVKKFSELEGEKCQVIQLNDTALQEIFETATQSEVLKGFGVEKVAELKVLLGDLIRQREVNSSLEEELKLLREKLELQNAESLVLRDAVRSMEEELREMTEFNVQMDQDIRNGKEKLIHTEAELLDTEMKLAAVEELNSSLSRTVAELKKDAHQSLEIRENLRNNITKLSEDNSSQKKEIDSLQRTKKNLESELGLLHQEIEDNMMRELSLNTELQEMNNEFEVWEAEASTFCFDLQVSAVQEVLLKNKVEELTGVCKMLENECTTKTLELEEMKGKVCSSENEITGLKSQLNTYAPIIASLRDNVTLLERNLLLQADFKASQGQEPEFSGVSAYPNEDSFEMRPHDRCLLNLKDLQIRVKAVRELMERTNRPVLQSCRKESAVDESEQLKPHRSFARDKHERSRRKGQANGLYSSPKLQRMKSKVSEGRSGMLMKDIPLDQVSDNPRQGMSRRGCIELDDQILELWKTPDNDNKVGESPRTAYKKDMECDLFENFEVAGMDPPSTDSDMERELDTDYNKLYLPAIKAKPDGEVADGKILNRLASDAERLDLLQTVVDNLRTTWESTKKRRKVKKSDFEAVHNQLLEAEDTLVQLIDLNGQLVNHIELCPQDEAASPRLKETVNTWRMKVLEQAEKGSERIGRLHLELQRIQYNLMKLADDDRQILKGRNRFFRSRSIILRDFVHIGRKNSRRRKKDPNCAWFRQPNREKVNSL